jgi:hypothetical protein
MPMGATSGDLVIGAASGYLAGFAMDRATGVFLARQSEESIVRQDELAPGGAPALFVRRAAGAFGANLGLEASEPYALALHRTLTATYGLTAAALVTPERPPMRSAFMTVGAALVFVDEGLPTLRIVPPPSEWPLESHLRGVIGHLTLAVGIGVLLSLAQRLFGLGRR